LLALKQVRQTTSINRLQAYQARVTKSTCSVTASISFYNKHSHEQGKANTCGLPLLVEAVNSIDFGQIGDEFRIADFGSAQGQNSLLPIENSIAHIKARTAAHGRTAIPISVTHTDLPTNDWTTLFQTVFRSPESYLAGVGDVFCFASGTSIYHQIFPPNHLELGYSAITTHWLSREPCNIPNEIWSARATESVHDTWAKQAKADGTRFYNIARLKCSRRLGWSSSPAGRTRRAQRRRGFD